MDDLWWLEEIGGEKPARGRLTIREAKRIPIRRLLEHYGAALPATRANQPGGWGSIACPFHRDRKPSASWNEREGRFRCHTCDVGGDVVDLVREREGTSIAGALKWLEENM